VVCLALSPTHHKMSDAAAEDEAPSPPSFSSQASEDKSSVPPSQSSSAGFSKKQKEELAELVAQTLVQALGLKQDAAGSLARKLTPDPNLDPDNFVAWQKWYDDRFHVTPRANQIVPGLFNLHGEPTHDALIAQNRTAAVQEWRSCYAASFYALMLAHFMGAALASADEAAETSPDPLFRAFYDQMCLSLNTLNATIDIITARMAVVQVSAGAGRGEFTPGYAEYVAQRAQANTRMDDIFNAEHRTWYADYLKQHSEQAVRQLARAAVTTTFSNSPKNPKTATSRPKILKKTASAGTASTSAAEEE
jgi:hypothetical protein